MLDYPPGNLRSASLAVTIRICILLDRDFYQLPFHHF